MELKKKKTNPWILLFTPFIFPVFFAGWVVGFVAVYFYSGYKSAGDFMIRLSGFETKEELIKRVISEKLEAK